MCRRLGLHLQRGNRPSRAKSLSNGEWSSTRCPIHSRNYWMYSTRTMKGVLIVVHTACRLRLLPLTCSVKVMTGRFRPAATKSLTMDEGSFVRFFLAAEARPGHRQSGVLEKIEKGSRRPLSKSQCSAHRQIYLYIPRVSSAEHCSSSIHTVICYHAYHLVHPTDPH
jgi:hypothetical protein